MSKPRIFSKAEIRDAAMAAAETGLSVRLLATGEMQFTHTLADRIDRDENENSPEAALDKWVMQNAKTGRTS